MELTRQLTGAALSDLKSSQAQWWADRRTCYPEEDVLEAVSTTITG
jgi:hypothetical protein